jgi:hypothetical protein
LFSKTLSLFNKNGPTYTKLNKIVQTFANKTKIKNICFSGGLFMGIALFHLLPESGESLADYFEKNNSDSD